MLAIGLIISALVAAASADAKNSDSSRYIVLFKRPADSGADEAQAYAANIQSNEKLFEKDDKILSKISNGYVAQFSQSTADKIKDAPEVMIVEKDQEVSIQRNLKVLDFPKWKLLAKDDADAEDVNVQENAPWGISRISGHKYSSISKTFTYPSNAGHGVKVYIIDTGIDISHPEFEGRALWGTNLVEGSPDTDENGHGTHCAGVISGSTVGIAKKAEVVAVKALSKEGVGMISKLILGVDFVMKRHAEEQEKIDAQNRERMLRRRGPASNRHSSQDFLDSLRGYLEMAPVLPKTVVNMSIGGIKSPAMNYALEYASKCGIHFVAAAGNDNVDACSFSPGSSRVALTVGASNKHDSVAFFSNYGDCVDVYAPGQDILSTWPRNEYKIISGTSMAAPHVSGIMALYLGEDSYKPMELAHAIIRDAQSVVKQRSSASVVVRISALRFLLEKQSAGLPLASIEKLLRRLQTQNGADAPGGP